jgi:hypothetical protein
MSIQAVVDTRGMKRMLIVRALALLGCIVVGLGVTVATGDPDLGNALILGVGIGLALFAATMILEDTGMLPRLRLRK